MKALGVVEALDVGEDRRDRGLAGGIGLVIDLLELELGEETLHGGVIKNMYY